MNKTVYITGLGGQGVIVMGNILADAANELGYEVKQLQTINLAMRLGPVQTTVRYGEKVNSPMVYKNSADIIIGFEKLEAARAIDLLKEDGHIFINDLEIKPMSVVLEMEKYPENLDAIIEKKTGNIHYLDAGGIAEKAGTIKAMNIVMLGALSKVINFDNMEDIIKKHVPSKYIDLNLKAFNYGKELI